MGTGMLDLTELHMYRQVVDGCDGTVDGKEYFQCDAGHGVLVRPEEVSVLTADGTVRTIFLPKQQEGVSFGFDLIGPNPPADQARQSQITGLGSCVRAMFCMVLNI